MTTGDLVAIDGGKRKRQKIDLERAVELAAAGLTLRQTALLLDVPRSTLSDALRRDEDLHHAWEVGRARALLEASRLLWAKAAAGDTIAAIYITKTLGWRDSGPAVTAGEDLKSAAPVVYLPANGRE